MIRIKVLGLLFTLTRVKIISNVCYTHSYLIIRNNSPNIGMILYSLQFLLFHITLLLASWHHGGGVSFVTPCTARLKVITYDL